MYKVYRCQVDKKLFLPDDLEKHQGHKVGYGQDETLFESLKVIYWTYSNKLEKRANYQS